MNSTLISLRILHKLLNSHTIPSSQFRGNIILPLNCLKDKLFTSRLMWAFDKVSQVSFNIQPILLIISSKIWYRNLG